MATHQQPSPTAGIPPHHGPPAAHAQPNGHPQGPPQQRAGISEYLRQANEATWMQVGRFAETMGDLDNALHSYEQVLRCNTWSVPAMIAIAAILHKKDRFAPAIEYLNQILKLDPNNGEVWGMLGHCHLMIDDLQAAYSAYQQALYHLQDPKEPKLWYGIGILYDRYGSLEHAEEAFSQVMRMQPDFDKANEIYFRLGIIYKQQQKFQQSLECFKYIVQDPPRPLTEEDIWFQIGHVYEQQKDYDQAKIAYRRVLERDPKHAKVLQQLGWLHHQQSPSYQAQEQAIEYLEQSVAADQTDAQSWYLLGRCYMSQQKYPKAYEAYQQAVYRDGRNPTFWCSIGVLYYQINQYRDALDAYSRAIRLNPNISEVWYDLGTLYESCNNQTSDALDAYQRAADLDPTNIHIKARLQLLQNGQAQGGMPNQNNAPVPQDVHPQAYQPGLNGPPGPHWAGSGPVPQSQQQPGGPPAIDYGARLAEIQRNPPPPPQHINPYDPHEASRQPSTAPPINQARPPSPPRADAMRPHYPPEPQTQPQPQQQPPQPPHLARRGLTPSPKTATPTPHWTRGLTNVTSQQPQQQQPPPPPPPQQGPAPPQVQLREHQQPAALNRVINPNYGLHSSSVPPPPTTLNGPPQPGPPSGPYGRMTSPPAEVRPVMGARPPSAGSNFQPPYPHPPTPSMRVPDGPPPPPAPAAMFAPPETVQRDRDGQTPSAPKRLREWEDGPQEEKRPRLEDPVRGPTPIQKPLSPPHRSSPTQERRTEEPRRPNDGYHPSEAAHHPPMLPSLQQHAPQPLPQMVETVKEERRETYEPAARKMDIDEDYGDDDDDKKSKSERNSPRSGAPPNGVGQPVENKS